MVSSVHIYHMCIQLWKHFRNSSLVVYCYIGILAFPVQFLTDIGSNKVKFPFFMFRNSQKLGKAEESE